MWFSEPPKLSRMACKNNTFPKIVLFGDSLTQFSFDVSSGAWGAILANRLQRKCDVVNRGFSGYNTKLCRLILPSLFVEHSIKDVEAFLIFLGANDACFPDGSSGQHIPLDEYKDNLREMILYVTSLGLAKEKIVLVTPPAYDIDAHSHVCREGDFSPDRSNERAGLYSLACDEVGKLLDVDVANLYEAMLKEKNWKLFLSDGLHLSKEGGAFVADVLWPQIERRTKFLKEIFPDWKLVINNPENVLC